MSEKNKIYFASDFHLGLNTGNLSLDREKKIVSWLKDIAAEASEIYLLGDIFDFWWEYKTVVPKGFTRFLGTVSEITDSGVKVHFFTGNHDMWVKDYLSAECGMIVHTAPLTTTISGKKFHLAHGEGLGTKNLGFKVLLKVFHNKPLRILYSSLHPRIGVGLGHTWSLHSRLAKGISLEFMGEDKEDLLRYARTLLRGEDIDYFIFGHRHLAMNFVIGESKIIYLGDWISNSSFAEWDGNNLILKKYF